MIAGHDLGYRWSGPEHLPGCATSVDEIEIADPGKRKSASEVRELPRHSLRGQAGSCWEVRTQTGSAVFAASSVRHRCFAHCKELSNNKSKTSTSSEAGFGNAFRLTTPDAKFPNFPCFLPSRLAGHSVQKLSGLEESPDCYRKEEPDCSSNKCNQHDRSRCSDRFLLWVPS